MANGESHVNRSQMFESLIHPLGLELLCNVLKLAVLLLQLTRLLSIFILKRSSTSLDPLLPRFALKDID